MITKKSSGIGYIYVLFLMSSVFLIIMALLHITFLNAAIATNVVAAANLHSMAHHGIYMGLAAINRDIAQHGSAIKMSAIANNTTFENQAISFINCTTFSLQNGEYTVVVQVCFNNNTNNLQIRSTATKQNIHSSVVLNAIIVIYAQKEPQTVHYPWTVYTITPVSAKIYAIYEIF